MFTAAELTITRLGQNASPTARTIAFATIGTTSKRDRQKPNPHVAPNHIEHFARGADQREQRVNQQIPDDSDTDHQRQGQPQTIRRQPLCITHLARPNGARDDRRRTSAKPDGKARDGQRYRKGERQRGQLLCSKLADIVGIDERHRNDGNDPKDHRPGEFCQPQADGPTG